MRLDLTSMTDTTYRLLLDGVDVSQDVNRVTITAVAGATPKVEILLLRPITAFSGEAEVSFRMVQALADAAESGASFDPEIAADEHAKMERVATGASDA